MYTAVRVLFSIIVLLFTVAAARAGMTQVVDLPLGSGAFYSLISLGNGTAMLLSQAGNIKYSKLSEAGQSWKWGNIFAEGTQTHTYSWLTGGVNGDIAAINYNTYAVVGYTAPSSGAYSPNTPLGGSSQWNDYGLPSIPFTADPMKLAISRLAAGKMALIDTDGSVYLHQGDMVGWAQICNAGTATSGCVGFADIAVCDDGNIFGIPKLKTPVDTRLYRFTGNMSWETKQSQPLTSIDCGLSVNELIGTNAATGKIYTYTYAPAPSAGTFTELASGTYQSASISSSIKYAVAGTTVYKWV
jgi:hypothetical protein